MNHRWMNRSAIYQEELSETALETIHAWWRAANYLSVGQIYLARNPLMRRPIEPDDIKPRLLGHWGTTPGLNFLYAHMNRVIQERSQPTIYVTGPGHGGPGLVANTYLEGTYSDIYPHVSLDETGMARLFKQFSFPGGIPSHAARDAGINQRGRGTWLLPVPRLRGGFRQPRSARLYRGR